MTEPFRGDTPLHAAAREGHAEVCAKLLEAGARATIKNDGGRTALEEVQKELAELERVGEPNSALRRARLSDTIENMQIAMIALS